MTTKQPPTIWAIRLPSGNLLGGLFVHGCFHGDTCTIQTAEALKPEMALLFRFVEKARAVLALVEGGGELVKVELEAPK